MVSYILAGAVALLLLVCDQISKIFIVANYSLGENFIIAKGILNFYYIHNKGGAWGILSGYTGVLVLVTVVVMVACIVWLIFKGRKNKLLFWAVSLILSGGLGNMIDRIFRGGNVVDFLQFGFWEEFPIFNIADCGIVVGCGLLILYFIIDMVNDVKKRKREDGNG